MSNTPYAMAPADAARYIGVSRSTIYRLMRQGEIPVVKVGRRTLLLTEHLADLVSSRIQPFQGRAKSWSANLPPESAQPTFASANRRTILLGFSVPFQKLPRFISDLATLALRAIEHLFVPDWLVGILAQTSNLEIKYLYKRPVFLAHASISCQSQSFPMLNVAKGLGKSLSRRCQLWTIVEWARPRRDAISFAPTMFLGSTYFGTEEI